MNKKEVLITIARISKYKRKLSWHTKRLAGYVNILNDDYDENDDDMYDDKLSTIKERILKHQKAISEYEKRLAWNTKRLVMNC